jgi:iron complex outermembrane receptor protein
VSLSRFASQIGRAENKPCEPDLDYASVGKRRTSLLKPFSIILRETAFCFIKYLEKIVMNKSFISFALISFLTITTFAQSGTITGIVKDATTDSPLEGANVILIGKGIGRLTDKDGSFTFTGLDEGFYTVSASFIGYKVKKQTITVEVDKSTTVSLALFPTVLQGQVIEVTATRAQERETPVTFTNLPQKELREMYYAQDLPMILSQMPSTTWYSENGNGIGYSYVKMRGFDQARIGVTLNGVPLNDAQSHFVYWIDMPDMGESIKDIQVQRGGGISSYGSSAIGGTINLSTSDFAAEKGLQASYGYGSYNTQKVLLAVSSGLVDNTYAVYGRFSKVRTDGYRRNTWSDLWSYHLSFARYDEALTTQLNIFGGPECTHLSYEGVTKQELQTDRRANKFTYANETDNFNQPQYQLINEWQINPALKATSTLYYIKGDGYYEQFKSAKKLTDYGLSSYQISDSLLYPRAYYDVDDNNNFIIAPNGTVTVKRTDLVRQKALDLQDYGWIPNIEWNHTGGILQIGGEVRANMGRHFGTLVWGSSLPPGTQPNLLYYDYWGYRNSYGIYIRENYKIAPTVSLLAGLQYLYTNYGIKDDIFSHHRYSLDYSFLMPRFGINYNVTSKMNLFTYFSQVKREPTLNDIHNEGDPLFNTVIPGIEYKDPLLKPETLNDIELGIGYTTDLWNVKFNTYWMDFHDELVYGGQINSVGEPILGNAEHSIHQGTELTGSISLLSGFSATANLTMSQNYFVTYLEHTYDVDTSGNYISYKRDGNTIAGFPDIIANARLQYESNNFSITISFQHVGKQYIDNSENERKNLAARTTAGYVDKIVNPYSVVNFSMQYRLRSLFGHQGITFSLHINNAFDSRYEYAGHIGYDDGLPRWFPAADRNFFASIKVNL